MSATIELEDDTPTLEETPAPAVVPVVPAVPTVVLEDSPPSVVAATPQAVFSSNKIRPEFKPAGLGAVPRRSSIYSSNASRGRSSSIRPKVHDRAWEERERKTRKLQREAKEVAKLQGEVDILTRQHSDYSQVVSRDATAVNSIRRERDSPESGLLQELAVVRGLLKKKVIV